MSRAAPFAQSALDMRHLDLTHRHFSVISPITTLQHGSSLTLTAAALQPTISSAPLYCLKLQPSSSDVPLSLASSSSPLDQLCPSPSPQAPALSISPAPHCTIHCPLLESSSHTVREDTLPPHSFASIDQFQRYNPGV